MKKYYLIIILFLLITYKNYSNEVIEKYKIDYTSTASFIINDSDSILTKIPFGNIIYKDGKLNQGEINIYLLNDSINFDQTPEAETYIEDKSCMIDDTLRISFDRTFFNSRAKKSEPNYTALASLCYKGFENNLAFPIKITVYETHIHLFSEFSVDLSKVFTLLNYQDEIYQEVKIYIDLKAIQISEN
jgi:hypothetical protein